MRFVHHSYLWEENKEMFYLSGKIKVINQMEASTIKYNKVQQGLEHERDMYLITISGTCLALRSLIQKTARHYQPLLHLQFVLSQTSSR